MSSVPLACRNIHINRRDLLDVTAKSEAPIHNMYRCGVSKNSTSRLNLTFNVGCECVNKSHKSENETKKTTFSRYDRHTHDKKTTQRS